MPDREREARLEAPLLTVRSSAYLTEYAPLLGKSPAMRDIRDAIESIADTDATVLIRGESGVGKEVIARAIHAASARHAGPFIKVNCAALPPDLLESELFGHEKGSFTGAYRRKPGQFEYANEGTIYLDEIGELALGLQVKLLHVLQDFRFSRVGGTEPISVDVRILAATNRDLETAISRSQFREDLYYRLNVVEIRVPPLRERKEEISDLAERFLSRFSQQYRRTRTLTPEIVQRLMAHSWPGNVRELENMIRRLVVFSEPEQALESLSARRSCSAPPPLDPATVNEGLREIARRGAREAEQRALAQVLAEVGWNRVKAAKILKVSYKTLLTKLADFGLVPPPRQPGGGASA
jgi:transcriptional regulator with PAS, ATPase and Fis domain